MRVTSTPPCPECFHPWEPFHYWNAIDNRNECLGFKLEARGMVQTKKRCDCGGKWQWSTNGAGLRW